jgi:hypothetical protein
VTHRKRADVLEFVDRVLGDLALRGGMFVARRPEGGEPDTIVVQTGEEGRYRIAVPEPGTATALERFMADAQAYLSEVFGQPVPRCPLHDHALIAQPGGREPSWVCPDGDARCAVGEYDELNWPPRRDDERGGVPSALVKRFARRGIAGWQRVGVSLRDGRWVARVRMWPVDADVVAQIRRATAPIEVEIEPGEEPDPAAWRRALDQRLVRDLEWARWAVDRWADFPVDQVPRPLVLLHGAEQQMHGGFSSGEAKLAFIRGLVQTAVPVPEAVLGVLRDLPAGTPPADRGVAPVVITAATPGETEFSTDRGPRVLPAWRLEVEGATGPVWVLDPDMNPPPWRPHEPSIRPRPAPTPSGGDPVAHVGLGPDGRTLTLRFTGALPIFEQYPRAEVIESPQAVAIVPVAKDVGPRGIRILPGHEHQVTVRLDKPLGARVFVDLHGHPGQVTTSADS